MNNFGHQGIIPGTPAQQQFMPGTPGQQQWQYGPQGPQGNPFAPVTPPATQQAQPDNAPDHPIVAVGHQLNIAVAEMQAPGAPGESPFHRVARGYCRWVNAIDDLQEILAKGGAVDPANPRNAADRHIRQEYEKMTVKIPGLEAALAERGPKGITDIGRELNRGKQAARAEDNANVKESMAYFYDFKSPLPQKKEHRGYHHDDCAWLLASTNDDILDPKIREEYKSGVRVATSGDFPRLMYENYTPVPGQLFAGWLKSPILIKTGTLIAFGKASTKNGRGNDRPHGRGIANIHGYHQATIEFIAYSAMLAHFALTSKRTLLVHNGTGAFTYAGFYKAIIKCYNVMFKSEKVDLISFWNKHVYGDNSADMEVNLEDATDEFPPTSIAAMMFAQGAELADNVELDF